jgi:ketosteroid isomerase-like protein
MLKISKLICGTLIALSTVSVPKLSAADASATASDDKASIEALVMRFRDAFVAKDVDAVMQAYAPGNRLFVFDVTPPRQHVGWQDYKKDWQALFEAFPGPTTYSISDLSIAVVGSVAYSHRIEQGQFTRKDGSKMDLVVRVTDVCRKLKGSMADRAGTCVGAGRSRHSKAGSPIETVGPTGWRACCKAAALERAFRP